MGAGNGKKIETLAFFKYSVNMNNSSHFQFAFLLALLMDCQLFSEYLLAVKLPQYFFLSCENDTENGCLIPHRPRSISRSNINFTHT